MSPEELTAVEADENPARLPYEMLPPGVRPGDGQAAQDDAEDLPYEMLPPGVRPGDGQAAQDDAEDLDYEPPEREAWVPPAGVARYLKPNERNVICVREHPVVLAVPAVALAGGLVLASAANIALLHAHRASATPVHVVWWAFTVAALWAAWRWQVWRHRWIVITADRLMTVSGVLTRRIDMLPLSKLRDLSMSQPSPLARSLGYGSFHCTSIGTDGPEELHHLPDIDYLYTAVCELIMPATGRMGPGA